MYKLKFLYNNGKTFTTKRNVKSYNFWRGAGVFWYSSYKKFSNDLIEEVEYTISLEHLVAVVIYKNEDTREVIKVQKKASIPLDVFYISEDGDKAARYL